MVLLRHLSEGLFDGIFVCLRINAEQLVAVIAATVILCFGEGEKDREEYQLHRDAVDHL